MSRIPHIVIAALALAATLRAAEPSAFQLQPEAQADSQGIYLDQLVADPAGCHVRLTNAPAFGAALVLTRAQVRDLVARKASSYATTNWSGAEKIRITRQSRMLGEDDVLALLTAALQKENIHDRGQLELRFVRAWQPVTVPDEPLNLRALELPSSGVASTFIVRFDVRCGQETIGAWSMPVQGRLWRDVLVAQIALRRGDRLQTADLVREKRDILTLRDAVASVDQNDGSLELTENIPAGSPLLARCVRTRPVVPRGKLVDAIIQDGFLTITVKAQALEDGLNGQVIRLRNSKSGREFRGKVQNEDTIEVAM